MFMTGIRLPVDHPDIIVNCSSFPLTPKRTGCVDRYPMWALPLLYQADPPLLKRLITNTVHSSIASRSATPSQLSISLDDRQYFPEQIMDNRRGTRRSCAGLTFPRTYHASRAPQAAIAMPHAIVYVTTRRRVSQTHEEK